MIKANVPDKYILYMQGNFLGEQIAIKTHKRTLYI